MARRKRTIEGITGGGMITVWALLLSWLFCPPVCVFLIVLLLFCGPEFAIAMYAGAVVVGIIWGIRNIIKERK